MMQYDPSDTMYLRSEIPEKYEKDSYADQEGVGMGDSCVCLDGIEYVALGRGAKPSFYSAVHIK